jgi:hypothetical protein
MYCSFAHAVKDFVTKKKHLIKKNIYQFVTSIED